MKTKRKKSANVMVEYGVLIIVLVAFLAGINNFLRRSIQARVRAESDELLGHGQGLEWASSASISTMDTTHRRTESQGGGVELASRSRTTQVTGQAPVPSIEGWSVMEHKGSALHIQDAAGEPPTPDYPDLEYKEWNDQGWPEW